LDKSTENRKELLKGLVRQLHAGTSPQEVKEKFKSILKDLNPMEIVKVEEELIREGLPREDVQELCEIHLAVFGEQLERQEIEKTSGNPVNVLMEEHKMIIKISEKLAAVTAEILRAEGTDQVDVKISEAGHIIQELMGAESHYLREENVLFPLLEKHGITEPPKIMWMEHDQIRNLKKRVHGQVESCKTAQFQEFKKQIYESVKSLSSLLVSHFFKENNILFPTALQVITEQEWKDAKVEFDEIGYCSFTPKNLIRVSGQKRVEKPASESVGGVEGLVEFETGSLSKSEIEAILNRLPVDITFIDKDDYVKYFNKAEGRIFVRTKSVLGRKVQQCHPQKSVHVVNKILESFKTGKRNVAEFWIQLKEHTIYIRYFAIRDSEGKYLGTLEVSQDITDVKKIQGEKRLLDWED